MKLKTILSLLIIFAMTSLLSAQSLINQGGNIIINAGSSLIIHGSFVNNLNGAVNNSGTMKVSGNWTNNQTSGSLLNGTSGEVVLNGTGSQVISGPAATFFNDLTLQNNAALGGPSDISISSNLTLSGTFLSMNNYNVVMQNGSNIIGAGSSAYIISNGSGKLKQRVAASNVTFPIGTISDYVPLILSNSGTADFFSARAFADVRTNGLTG